MSDGIKWTVDNGCQPVVAEFIRECYARFEDIPYMGGLAQLQVYEAVGRVRITDHNGHESVVEEGFVDPDGWL